MKRFCIIGYGFVGKAIESVLEDKHSIYIIDPGHNLFVKHTVKKAIHADGFIISVPTPDVNGQCDDSLVLKYVDEIHEHFPYSHILIKSTTSIETLKYVKNRHKSVTFSPEFLGSDTSNDTNKQFQECDFAIYGGTGGRWWHEVFKQLITYKNVRFLDIESAGFLKYTENAFLALKVTFFNEIHNLYNNTVNTNYDGMIEALALDTRIGMSHTQVPGPDGFYGFGGHCLPKDTGEFSRYAKENNTPLDLLDKAIAINTKLRKQPNN